MRTKALIIGARPSPWEGPWISIEDHEEWQVLPAGDYRGLVAVEVKRASGDSPVDHLLDGDELTISGKKARVKIKEGASELEHESISVNIRSV